ncbi:MAG TPA: class I SAM-dependent methyltransferase [Pilimelia sp.]|nr:class I SAM-dependent methyltransferase [Pilimelia sp.]
MRGQPCLTAGYPEPYAATADTYDRLARWAVAQWGESPRAHMVDFMQRLWSGRPTPVAQVLEVCCGTGLVLEQLRGRGYAVTGLDRSAAMLAQARARLGPGVPLVRAELPDIPLAAGRFDAVVCPAAALNYMPDRAALRATFDSVAAVLRPGGTFVFDLLSRGRLETGFARVWAGDLGDLAFIWRFTHDPAGGHSDLAYTQFLRRTGDHPPGYAATRELHRLYVLDRQVVRRAAAAAGFTDVAVWDNYSSRPAGATTDYETWTLTRP